jgi:cell division protein FtsB
VLGIGTTNPGSPLTVSSAAPTPLVLLQRTSNNNANIQYDNTSFSYWAGLAPSGSFGIGLNQNLDTSPTLVATQSGNVGGYSTIQFFDSANAGKAFVGYGNASSPYPDQSYWITGSGVPILLNAGGTEKMRIAPGGNVGIGTTSPAAKLQVVDGAMMPALGSTSASGILFPIDPGGGTMDSAWMRYYVKSGESTTLQIGTENDPDDDISFWQMGGPRLNIYNGNVGVGTTTPATRLEISESGTASTVLQLSNPGTGTNQGSYTAYVSKADGNQLGSTTNKGWYVGARSDAFSLQPNNFLVSHWDGSAYKEAFTVMPGGNIGIGTPTPMAKIHVIGGNNSWTDGIFFQQTGTGGRNYAIASREGGRFSISDESASAHRFTLLGNGNVGIGTSAPAFKIDAVNNVAGLARFSFSNPDASTYQQTDLRVGRGTSTQDLFLGTNFSSTQNAFIDNRSGGSLRLLNSGTDVLTIMTGGNVGIGTSSPATLLDIRGPTSPTLTIGDTGTGNNYGGRIDLTTNLTGLAQPQKIASSILGQADAGSGGRLSLSTSSTGGSLTERMRIDASGNVGVGTTSPNYKLEVIGDIRASGNLIANATTYSSDVRWKQNIEPLRGSLERLSHLKGVSYYWRQSEFPEMNFNERKQIGLIAQDVEKEFPELVLTNKLGFKSVNYAALVAPIIQALQELAHQAIGTEDRVAHLEAENARLKAADEAKAREIASLKADSEAKAREIASVKADSEAKNRDFASLRSAVCEINPKAKVCASR